MAPVPRVIVTRPRQQADALAAALRQACIDAVVLPLIEIRPVHDPAPIQRAWRKLPGLSLVMFVSANAVLHFMRQRPAGLAWPRQVLAASTGPGTAAALRQAGVPETALVEPPGPIYDSEALWQRLVSHDWAGRPVLIVRGQQGRDWLADRLRRSGATVEFVDAYGRAVPALDAGERSLLDQARAAPASWLWLFGSSEAVSNLGHLAGSADWSGASALASHPRIAASARQLGFGYVAQDTLVADAVRRELAACVARSIQFGAS
jgi:uroporphyrinogen-III synthase